MLIRKTCMHNFANQYDEIEILLRIDILFSPDDSDSYAMQRFLESRKRRVS